MSPKKIIKKSNIFEGVYECNICKERVVRVGFNRSFKRWRKSFCVKTGKNSRIYLREIVHRTIV